MKWRAGARWHACAGLASGADPHPLGLRTGATLTRLFAKSSRACNELKGGCFARKEISADSAGAYLERMRSCVWCLHLHRTCASTAVRTYGSNTDPANAIADPQSIQSRYRASTELPAHHVDNTEHSTFHTKHGSKS
jgi:hypothetical protein